MATSTAYAQGSEVGTAQPQTTVEASGGPFIRYAQEGSAIQYVSSNNSFGGEVTNPTVARPGYLRRYRATIAATGGVNGTVTVAKNADAPYNAVQNIMLKDTFGHTILNGGGFELLYLVPKYSGAFGLFANSDISNLPSFSGVSTGSAGTGNFSFSTVLPLEFAKGYGCVSIASSDLQPTIQWNLGTSANVYSTAPGTLPTLSVSVDADFYWLPNNNIAPPGLGTSRQWVQTQFQQSVTTGGNLPISAPRLGGYIDTVILIARDSTGARNDNVWTTSPGRLQLIVDGVQWLDKTINEILDDMAIAFPGTTRDSGVLVFTKKTSLSQVNLGLLDTGEQYLSTSPGTGLQIQMQPFGTFSNGPATITALLGTIVPAGELIQGLPEM